MTAFLTCLSTNAAPLPAARAAGPAPKPATSLAGLPVAHPFNSAADRLPAADREPVVVNPPAATGTHSARNPYAAVTVRCNAYPHGQFRFRCDGPVGQVANYEGQTRYLPFPHPLRLAGVLKSFGRLQAARNLLSRVKGFAEPLRGLCERLVFSPVVRLHGLLFPVSAARCGLVSAVYGRHSTEGKQACPTKEFPGAEIVFPKKI